MHEQTIGPCWSSNNEKCKGITEGLSWTECLIILCHEKISITDTLYWAELFKPPHDKTNNMTMHPAKTQISLGIHPVWSETSLCTQWVAKDPSFLHLDSEDSDQTGRMPRLIWVFAGRTCHCVGFVMSRLISVFCFLFWPLLNGRMSVHLNAKFLLHYFELTYSLSK